MASSENPGYRSRARTVVVGSKESSQSHSIPRTGQHAREVKRKRLDKEMMWKEFESIDSWLDEYVPGVNPSLKFAPYNVDLGGDECNMYDGWVSGILFMIACTNRDDRRSKASIGTFRR